MGPFIAKLFQVFSHWSLESQSQFRFQSTRTAEQPASQPAGQTDLVMEVAPRPKKLSLGKREIINQSKIQMFKKTYMKPHSCR